MYLNELLNGVAYKIIGDGNPQISSLSCETSTLKSDCLFFCLKGQKYDGHDFFRKAVGDGCAALVCQKPLDTKALQVIVDDTRVAMAQIAKNFYGNCADKLKIISVVGTNGKTSTCFILDSILSAVGFNTAVIGTNGIYFNGRHFESPLTTPDPILLHYWFRQMYLNKVQIVIMEVSAHAIALKKMSGAMSEIAIFTNFSQDHLDFFKTMENYAAVKASFFSKQFVKNAVVNIDDKLGEQICSTFPNSATYSLTKKADCVAKVIESNNEICFDAELNGQTVQVKSRLSGKFNVYNIAAAMTCAMLMNIDVDRIVSAVREISYISGRNETFKRSDGMRIVVDFAHTPDGVDNILMYLKQSTKGKLIVVFGCGGNRDKFKRPLMAEKVSTYADFAILTNDNPRFEDPNLIVQDIIPRLSCPYKIILNRSQATAYAFSLAMCDDTIAILGKGAETFQEIKGKKVPYSDIDVVKGLLLDKV